MMYAKFTHPDYGFDCNIEFAKEVGLVVGEKYEVDYISMGQSDTSVYLKGVKGVFNSIQFDFEEDGEPIDIYTNPKYNPYYRLRNSL